MRAMCLVTAPLHLPKSTAYLPGQLCKCAVVSGGPGHIFLALHPLHPPAKAVAAYESFRFAALTRGASPCGPPAIKPVLYPHVMRMRCLTYLACAMASCAVRYVCSSAPLFSLGGRGPLPMTLMTCWFQCVLSVFLYCEWYLPLSHSITPLRVW